MAAAFSRSKALAGLVTGDTQSDAEYNALTYCGQLTGNGNCQGAEWVLHGWLALAYYNIGTASKPNIQAWAVEPGQTAQGAKNNAVNLCDYLAGSSVCAYIGEEPSPSTAKPYAQGGPSVGANDYPTFLAAPPQDSVNPDPWGFFNRECTSFVAWRVNDNNGIRFSNNMTGPNGKKGHFGAAYQWKQNALNIGYKYSTVPTARSVAWWGPNYHGAGAAGHVAYVDSVTKNGSTVVGITIEQYNWGTPGSYSTKYVKVSAGSYPEGFIHGLEGGRLVGP
jgi:surface antigen